MRPAVAGAAGIHVMNRTMNRWPLFLSLFLSVGFYFLVLGESGILERIHLKQKRANILTEIEALKSERSRLSRLLARYRQGQYPDEDLFLSGYVKPGAKVIQIRGINDEWPLSEKATEGAPSALPLPCLRAAWIVVSAVTLGLIAMRGNIRAAIDKRISRGRRNWHEVYEDDDDNN